MPRKVIRSKRSFKRTRSRRPVRRSKFKSRVSKVFRRKPVRARRRANPVSAALARIMSVNRFIR